MFGIGEEYSQRFQKGVLILLFLFLVVSLIITWNVPAAGFESSIYSSTPLIFWIALVLSMIGGIIIVIWSVSDSRFNPGSPWKYGLLMIFLGYTLSLSLFIIRGYYMWDMIGDPATHIGYINDILLQGHTSSGLFYPITHIFLAEISLITTLDVVFLHKIIPLFFSLLCVVFLYIFVRVLSSNKIEPVMAGIVACTSFFAGQYFLNLTPNILCDLFFPLSLFILFKYFKSYNVGWGITLGIMLILLPIFHLVPSIFLGIVLLTLWIPFKLHDIWDYLIDRNPDHLNRDRKNIKVVKPLLILIMWSILWYSSFSVYGDNVTVVYEKVIGEGASYLNDVTLMAGTAQQYGYNIVEIILKQYGNPIDLFILSVMAFPLMWIAVSRKQNQESQNNFFSIFSFYGPFGALCIILPILYLIKLSFDPFRFVFFIGLLGVCFTGYFVTYFLLRNGNKSSILTGLTRIFVLLLLVGLFLVGLSNLYSSPYNYSYSPQTTHGDISGMVFFLDYRNLNVPVSGIIQAPGRYADLLLTPEKSAEQKLAWYLKPKQVAPWHFGYDQYYSISSSYKSETNLIITQRERVLYTDYLPDMAKYRFFPQDFERLKDDSGANLIYSNGGFDMLTIMPGG